MTEKKINNTIMGDGKISNELIENLANQIIIATKELTKAKAKKTYTCLWCRRTIIKDETYYHRQFKRTQYHYHEDCVVKSICDDHLNQLLSKEG